MWISGVVCNPLYNKGIVTRKKVLEDVLASFNFLWLIYVRKIILKKKEKDVDDGDGEWWMTIAGEIFVT